MVPLARNAAHRVHKPPITKSPPDELNEPAEPDLGSDRGLKIAQGSEDLLGPVKREHKSRHDAHQCIGLITEFSERVHLRPPSTHFGETGNPRGVM